MKNLNSIIILLVSFQLCFQSALANIEMPHVVEQIRQLDSFKDLDIVYFGGEEIHLTFPSGLGIDLGMVVASTPEMMAIQVFDENFDTRYFRGVVDIDLNDTEQTNLNFHNFFKRMETRVVPAIEAKLSIPQSEKDLLLAEGAMELGINMLLYSAMSLLFITFIANVVPNQAVAGFIGRYGTIAAIATFALGMMGIAASKIANEYLNTDIEKATEIIRNSGVRLEAFGDPLDGSFH